MIRNAKRGSGVRLHVDSKHPPPHAAGVGTSGWWGGWKGFSFVSQASVAFRGRSAVPALPVLPGVGGGSAAIRRC